MPVVAVALLPAVWTAGAVVLAASAASGNRLEVGIGRFLLLLALLHLADVVAHLFQQQKV